MVLHRPPCIHGGGTEHPRHFPLSGRSHPTYVHWMLTCAILMTSSRLITFLRYVPQNEALVLLQEYGEEPLEANTWGEYTWNLLLQDWILAPNRKLGAKPSSDAME